MQDFYELWSQITIKKKSDKIKDCDGNVSFGYDTHCIMGHIKISTDHAQIADRKGLYVNSIKMVTDSSILSKGDLVLYDGDEYRIDSITKDQLLGYKVVIGTINHN